MQGTLGKGQTLSVYDIGTVPYREALELQHTLVGRRQREEIGDMLLLLEHPPVVTMGRSAVADHVLAPESVIERAGGTVEYIERGGETTYHGPGQLVGYAILDLRAHLRSLKKFVYLLEEVFIRYLRDAHDITAGRDPDHRGVWVADEKITALGIAVQRRVTFHGFAFNVNTNLSHFDWIIPCGITDRSQTSLRQITGRLQEMSAVKEGVARAFADIFGYRWDSFASASPERLRAG